MNKKIYKCCDPIGPGVEVKAPEKCCLFCKHCTDVFWDYTHGPYMMFCGENHDVDLGAFAECEYFEEED